MTRRSGIEQDIAILTALRNKVMPLTHIMYASNINCTALKKSLGKMLARELVEQLAPIPKRGWAIGKSCKRHQYRLTEYGQEICKLWEAIKIGIDGSYNKINILAPLDETELEAPKLIEQELEIIKLCPKCRTSNHDPNLKRCTKCNTRLIRLQRVKVSQ